MEMKKSKNVRNGDLIVIKKGWKICKLRKDSKMPHGMYFSERTETVMNMDGIVRDVTIPEHIKIRGMLVI